MIDSVDSKFTFTRILSTFYFVLYVRITHYLVKSNALVLFVDCLICKILNFVQVYKDCHPHIS